jgi:hypothetical protein
MADLCFFFVLAKNKSFSNGPGKALRQDNSTPALSTYSYESYKKYINNANNKSTNDTKNIELLESTLKSTNISSSNNKQSNFSNSITTPISASNLEIKLDNNNTITTKTVTAADNISNEKIFSTNGNNNSTSYIINKDKEEDIANLEKFKRILNQNPVNLEELQKASWKGIPKIYRPVCWKLLSVKFFIKT